MEVLPRSNDGSVASDLFRNFQYFSALRDCRGTANRLEAKSASFNWVAQNMSPLLVRCLYSDNWRIHVLDVFFSHIR